MIEARKSNGFESIFSQYSKHYLLRRHFHEVTFRGDLDPFGLDRPVVYIMNHSTWWDGLLAYHAIKTVSTADHYMMMDEKQLQRYRFFSRIGAFSIDKSSIRGMVDSLDYAMKLLDTGGRVWMFPQGEICHTDIRPLRFQTGIGFLLAKIPSAAVVPVTMFTSMVRHQKPEASLWAGELLLDNWKELGRRKTAEKLRGFLERQLDDHHSLVMTEQIHLSEGFIPILRAGRSTNNVFDDFRKKVGQWKGYFRSS